MYPSSQNLRGDVKRAGGPDMVIGKVVGHGKPVPPVDERGRTRPARPSSKQRVAAWAPGVRRIAVRAKQALGRG